MALPVDLLPDQVEFVILSFEGPDRYAQAGGLGVRVANLAQTLARKGFRTHLIFVGDPDLPGQEELLAGRLRYYRWCQWISRYYPLGVYSGEEQKLADFNASLPDFLIAQIVTSAVRQGRNVVVLAEEWHTAAALIRLSDQLHLRGLRGNCTLLWNANNTMGFERIDWARLGYIATITTVSRYMKQILHGCGQEALVIPNGIPPELIEPVQPGQAARLRQALAGGGELLLFKVGRFDPAKCWWMAVEIAARLKRDGEKVRFLCRGGIEPYGGEVLHHARELGLEVREVSGQAATWEETLALIQAAGPADLYNLQIFMPQQALRVFYAAADFVLANSKHEPFGLVGLEAMAAGGLVFTGPTGETYSADNYGAIALDTETPDELALHIQRLRSQPELAESMRKAARRVASRYTWEHVLPVLFEKINLAATRQSGPALSPPSQRVKDVVVYTVIHQPRRLRLPARPIPRGATATEMAGCLFDEEMNLRYFNKVTERCYLPATRNFLDLVRDKKFKLTLGFSLSFIEQARRWNPALIELFQELVAHPNVDLAVVEPYHSFLLLWDVPRFAQRMLHARRELAALFGKDSHIADTTELMMSDTIYHALNQVGFRGAFLDGRPWVLDWRQPTYLYTHNQQPLRLLARHFQLSDDVGYRFSDRHWNRWPLMASEYAGWVANAQGNLVTLGWDYETFGEHHSRESGIFEFLDHFVSEAQERGLHFRTASEVVEWDARPSHDLPLPVLSSTWAGSGGLDFFLGNPAQQTIFQLMLAAYNKALLTGDPELIDIALWLAQSDNLHLIQWYGRQGSEAEVSAYFTPREWWQLGPDGIIAEMQAVYRNFIQALDEHLSPSSPLDPAQMTLDFVIPHYA